MPSRGLMRGIDQRNLVRWGAEVKWNFPWTTYQFFSNYTCIVNGDINYYVIIEWPESGGPLLHPPGRSLHLIDFGKPPTLLLLTFKTLHHSHSQMYIVWFHSFKNTCWLNATNTIKNGINYEDFDWVNYSRDLETACFCFIDYNLVIWTETSIRKKYMRTF